jgi:hypothetical protein
MQKKIVCTTRYESLFFHLFAANLPIREKSMTFITSCINYRQVQCMKTFQSVKLDDSNCQVCLISPKPL